jgi:hypothetical protein
MIWGDSVRVYARENESFGESVDVSASDFQMLAFRKSVDVGAGCELAACASGPPEGRLTSPQLLYPLVNFL